MIVVVTGTGTEVGKTYITAAVGRALRARGVDVAARKPVQSFTEGDATTDADVLAAATGERTETVCPAQRRLPVAMAPPMAAAALGRPPFTIADLVAELDAPAGAIVLVEGAGGLRSPLTDDGDTLALTDALSPTLVVLVADAGLGTINLVRLCSDALAAHRVVVYLNRFDAGDDLHLRNREWLVTRDGLDVVTDVEALTALLLPV
ncbi:MAG: dethiobiotin synthase [Actinomycetota bacterium]|nr:dethiobiotin synthase [Actinomycetota bacterium]